VRAARSLARVLVRVVVVGLATAVVACGGGGTSVESEPPRRAGPPARADDGARIVSVRRLSDRMLDLTVDSPAVHRQVRARLLLPRRSDRATDRPLPVLYLLHGCCDSYASWTRSTDIAALSARLQMLVVMPEGGRVGFYSNWLRGPAWETFHLVELRQLLERNYRAGPRRAIAGVSMGGLGAVAYAARNRGMFRAAATYSGLLHTRANNGADSRGLTDLIAGEGEDPAALWGDPGRQANRWAAHNPYDLAGRLRGTRLFVSSGTGDPGPLDPSGTRVDAIERFVHTETVAFTKRASALRIHPTLHLYGRGTHNWRYWQRELRRSWPLLTDALGLRG
jgi:diacylglycerol O-acyltransferase / trehalose O-mycolyltransferase